MDTLHTHYDNLKVARNAPPEVIRAAYKTLSQKYHPDKNPDNPQAARIMSVINTSYDILTDPVQKSAHDRWIAEQELMRMQAQVRQYTQQAQHTPPRPQPTPQPQSQPIAPQPSVALRTKVWAHVLRNPRFYSVALVLFGIFVWDASTKTSTSQSKTPVATTPRTSKTATTPSQSTLNVPAVTASAESAPYVRPATAPNGSPWPITAGYVAGYKLLNDLGISTVTVDNRQNNADVFVKLYLLVGTKRFVTRVFFIPAYSAFTAESMAPGLYDVRYMDLDSGDLARTESFILKQSESYSGTEYSNITLTLYKVKNGNMQTTRMSVDEF